MSSISRIRGGLVNAQREVSRPANAASLPDAIHRLNEEAKEARDIHPRNETSITSPEDAYIKATNNLESDSNIAGVDIIGECSSPSVATQDHPDTSATASNFEAASSSAEDINGMQEPSAKSSADGAQSTAQRLGQVARENPMLAAATIVTGAGVAVVAAPALITAPIMGIAGMVGFTPAGVAGASIASALQATIGNVAAGSLFATIQSAAAGGYGVAALTGTAQAIGGTVAGAGSIGTAWTWLRGKPREDSLKGESSNVESPDAEPSKAESSKR
ncbi:hypothetical protein HDV64DRAFT_241580 [Trichoderma sp. TUCIM 5745]